MRFSFSSMLLLAAMAAFLVGCGKEKGDDFAPVNEDDKVTDTPHVHEHGPHDGHIIEIDENEQYHAELVFDAETRKTTIYILGDDAKTAHPIKQTELELHLEGDDDEIEVLLKAAPLDGETEGTSSRFEAAGSEIPESIKDEEDIHGHLHVKIGDKMYSGDIAHDHDEDEAGKKQHDDKHKKDKDDKKSD